MAPPCWSCNIGVSTSTKSRSCSTDRSVRTTCGRAGAPSRGPAGGRSGRRSAAGPASPPTARGAPPGSGRTDLAAIAQLSAITDSSPRREVITSPCTNTWSPRSTGGLPAGQLVVADQGEAQHRLQLGAVALAQRGEAELAGVAQEDHPAGDAHLVAGGGVRRQVGVRGADLAQAVGARDGRPGRARGLRRACRPAWPGAPASARGGPRRGWWGARCSRVKVSEAAAGVLGRCAVAGVRGVSAGSGTTRPRGPGRRRTRSNCRSPPWWCGRCAGRSGAARAGSGRARTR